MQDSEKNFSLTSERLNDLETIKFFIPDCMKSIKITDQDIQDFFDYSERGLNKEKTMFSYADDGFNALCQGKRWRGIHMEMWEEGVLDGSVPYMTLLEGLSPAVVAFASKELFKGHDAELIKSVALWVNDPSINLAHEDNVGKLDFWNNFYREIR